MTGLSPRTQGDRAFQTTLPMPDAPTLAGCFREAGYRTSAVGKLHVFPQRDPIGFERVLLNEEGRHHDGMSADDWELFLRGRGHGGMAYAAGGSNNDYLVTPWHLPDDCHQTNWTAREMCRIIRGTDGGQPSFWYLSFAAPHPPMWPLRSYLDQYLHLPVDEPVRGDWAEEFHRNPPHKFQSKHVGPSMRDATPERVALVRRAFYAMITHVDHQIRVVLGTLRESGLLKNTVIAFTSDHGELLGDHGLWAKSFLYESSIRVPFIVAPSAGMDFPDRGQADDRLVELRDMMPTLLELAGIPVPETVEGESVFSDRKRTFLYGEQGEGRDATRMIREQRFKLIYYPDGNRFQLFDLEADPRECRDLSGDPGHREIQSRLQSELAAQLYGGDEGWIQDGRWMGLRRELNASVPYFEYSGQRGMEF